ncbi:MAG: NAD(P)/FAD-dependent oxidoreductase [Bacillota bacterium]
MSKVKTDVLVIGAGPAGLAAALAAAEQGAKVLIIDRENRAGGILKQCIHDGFGIVRYEEKLTGPEYAYRDIQAVRAAGLEVLNETYVLDLSQSIIGFTLLLQNPGRGVFRVDTKTLVAATGCRERTSRQVFIHGDRPAGIYNAGTAQNLINLHGYLPGRRVVILGSGDIGMIMARRLTLEGAEVLAVYELKEEPSGLTRNQVQCLEDYNIPLYLNTTVTGVHGTKRVTGVSVAAVGADSKPLPGSETYVPCDTLLLSVGLIPENDILDSLNPELDAKTGGPVVDQRMMTSVPGLFSCGNATHVNDLVDYVSESGFNAGGAAANYCQHGGSQGRVRVASGDNLFYTVPQRLVSGEEAVIYFRSDKTMDRVTLVAQAAGRELFREKYPKVRPPEMQKAVLQPLPPDVEVVELSLGEVV